PRSSHGRIFSATCWWRAAMNRKTSTSGSGRTPGRSKRRRPPAPRRVPSGSRVYATRLPLAESQRSRRRIWVVLPDPSTPSNVMSTPFTSRSSVPAIGHFSTAPGAPGRARGVPAAAHAGPSFGAGISRPAGPSNVADGLAVRGLPLAEPPALQDVAGEMTAAEAEGERQGKHEAAEEDAEGDQHHVAADPDLGERGREREQQHEPAGRAGQE